MTDIQLNLSLDNVLNFTLHRMDLKSLDDFSLAQKTEAVAIETLARFPEIEPHLDSLRQAAKERLSNSQPLDSKSTNNWAHIKISHPLRYHPRDLRLPSREAIAEKKKLENEYINAKRAKNWQEKTQKFPNRKHPFSFYTQQHDQFKTHWKATDSIENHTLHDISVATVHAQGARESQEDVDIACSGHFENTPYELMGIVDGHGGNAVANYVKAHIHEEIEKAVAIHGMTDEGIFMALKEAFVQLDAKIACDVGTKTGAVAVVSLKIGSQLYTANVGDCRAILKVVDAEGKKTLTVPLSRDAKAPDPRVDSPLLKSIKNRGGKVIRFLGWRVNGEIEPARAFGDKHLRNETGEYYVMSPRPKITKIDLNQYSNAKDIYLIQACDGIWDVATSKEASSVVRPNISLKAAALSLVMSALLAGSNDNCSALIAKLK